MIATVNVPSNTTEFIFKTKLRMSEYRSIDTSLEMTADASKQARFFVSDNYEGYRLSAAHESNKAIIHYKRQDNNYTGWTIHVQNDPNFGGALKPTTWAKSQAPDTAKPDIWGIKFTVPLTVGSTMLPFTIHKGNLADPVDRDQLLEIATTGGEIWIESGKVDAEGKIVTSNPASIVNTDVTGPTISQAQDLVGVTERSSFANDSIYFVMFDRYKNGDTTNDRGGLTGDVTQTGYLPTDWAYSHGGDLKGLADGCDRNDGSGDGIPRIKRLGFTAVWISPPFVQNFVQSGSSAYHGYFVTDFTRIDPHWGTNADFKNVSDCAHRLGMKVILDIVVNHTGDIIQYGASNNYDGSVNQTAYIPAGQENAKWPAFLNDLSNYHNMGPIRNWSNKSEYQNGDFGGLDDVKTENQAVVDGFSDVYAMWVNDYGVDGFRIDTAKHVDDQFFTRWFTAMEQKTQATMTAKGQKLFAFGEYYDGSTSTLSGYIHKQGLPSVLDFAFQPAAVGYAQGGDAAVLANVFKADNDYLTPTKSAYNLINFLGNHDMGRAAYLLRSGMSLTKLRKVDLLAHDVMFLTRGIPSIFYGDEVGMLGGGDKAARQDMFSTMVKTWKEEERVWGDPIGIQNSYNIVTPLTTRLTLLNQLRKDHPALASGAQWLRLQSGSVMVNSRIDATNRIEYLVAFNSGDKAKQVTVQTSTLSSSWTALLGSARVTSAADGKVVLNIPAQSTLVLKANKALPTVTTSPKVYQTVRTGNNSIRLGAAIRGMDPGTVTWAVKVNEGSWERVGTDDAGTYSMDWDYNTDRVSQIQVGDKLTFVAIYKNTSGGISVSKPEQITIK
jgi:glycosidase